MAFVIHPLTQQNGQPEYTAADFRLTVSNFLTVGERTSAFGAVQGLRATSSDGPISMSGSTITVHPHSGIIAPWAGVGAYAYAITSDITVPRPTTGDYYVVLTVEDPSQSHGSEPQGRVNLVLTSTPRESIIGLVIAQTVGNSINDIATRLRNSTAIETVSKAELDLIKPVTRTKGYVRFGEGIGEYEYDGSKWVPITHGPKIYQGSKIINGTGANGYNLLSTTEIRNTIGSDWGNNCTAAAMNGDRKANSVAVASVDYENGLNVRMGGSTSASFRINWLIVVS